MGEPSRGKRAERWRRELAAAWTTPAALTALAPRRDPAGIAAAAAALPARVPRAYAAAIDPDDPDDPLAAMVVPDPRELDRHPHLDDDPLGEDRGDPLPGVVHRYPDRVLLLVSGRCASICRFCMRRRLVGRAMRGRDGAWLARVVDYLTGQPGVREVLLSGGDPLLLSDGRLGTILAAVAAVPHVELLRVDSRAPVVLPSRVTAGLVATLRAHGPLWLVTHVNHPRELTAEVVAALGRLVDGGVPVANQAVLLRGVNDDGATLAALSRGLLRARVRPYYLHQGDPVQGTEHFRVPLARGQALVDGLCGQLPGLGIPRYVVDAPGGHGKVRVSAGRVLGREGRDVLLRAPDGAIARYPDVDDGGSATIERGHD